jgi:replication factor C subunit 3/5
MTKNAQQALKYLLQEYPNNVRFCLICNYISKIDEGLQNEFLKLRFDQLPIDHVIIFLDKLSKEEDINLSKNTLLSIQKLYKSDIRSMVNFIQTNQDILTTNYTIISEDTWISLYNTVSNNKTLTNQELLLKLNTISIQYNIDMRNIIVNFLNYIIKKYKHIVTPEFLMFTENIIHSDMNNDYGLQYFFNELQSYLVNE